MASGVRPRVTWVIQRSATCAFTMVPGWGRTGVPPVFRGRSTRLLSPNWNAFGITAGTALATPNSLRQVFLWKWPGVAASVPDALAIAFGPAAGTAAATPISLRHVFVRRLAMGFLVRG